MCIELWDTGSGFVQQHPLTCQPSLLLHHRPDHTKAEAAVAIQQASKECHQL